MRFGGGEGTSSAREVTPSKADEGLGVDSVGDRRRLCEDEVGIAEGDRLTWKKKQKNISKTGYTMRKKETKICLHAAPMTLRPEG